MKRYLRISALVASFVTFAAPQQGHAGGAACDGERSSAANVEAASADATPAVVHCLVDPEKVEAIAVSIRKMRAAGTAGAFALKRDSVFAHALVKPEDPDGRTIVLLHGSGGDETSLIELARRAAPRATLLGVKGRVVQEGVTRWYRRITPTSFDQADIQSEAHAFAAFLEDTASRYDLDLGRITLLGYSNGANLIGALSHLHPELVRRAVLLRAMPVLDETPEANLAKARFLTVAGEADETYAPYAPVLSKLLAKGGAEVDARFIEAGHLLGDEDARIVGEWLSAEATPSAE